MRKIGAIIDIDKPVYPLETGGIDFVLPRIRLKKIDNIIFKTRIEDYFPYLDDYIRHGVDIYGLYIEGYNRFKWIIPSFSMAILLKRKYNANRFIWKLNAGSFPYLLRHIKYLEDMQNAYSIRVVLSLSPFGEISKIARKTMKRRTNRNPFVIYNSNVNDSVKIMRYLHDHTEIEGTVIYYPQRKMSNVPNLTGMVFNSLLFYGAEPIILKPPPPKARLRMFMKPNDVSRYQKNIIYLIWKYGHDIVIEYPHQTTDKAIRDALFIKLYLQERYAEEKGIIKTS